MQEMLPNKYAYLANLPLLACLERECGGKCRGIHGAQLFKSRSHLGIASDDT